MNDEGDGQPELDRNIFPDPGLGPYPDDDDFQVSSNQFRSNLNIAIGGLHALAQFAPAGAKASRKRKRGPPASLVSNAWYSLPEGSCAPNLNKTESCPVYRAHKEAGYGYPSSCLGDAGKVDKVKLPIDMTAEGFREKVHELFPILRGGDFLCFLKDKQRKFIPLNINTPQELKQSGYRSVVYVKPVLPTASTAPSTSGEVQRRRPVPDQQDNIQPEVEVLASTSTPSRLSRPRNGTRTRPVPTQHGTVVDLDSEVLPTASTAPSTSGEVQRRRPVPDQQDNIQPEVEVLASTSTPSRLSRPRTRPVPTQHGTVVDLDSEVLPSTFTPLSTSGEVQRRRPVPDQQDNIQPEVEAPHIRTDGNYSALRLEQDIAYHSSLMADQQKAADRQPERELRQRRREGREELMKKNLEEIGEEPADGRAIIFRLPDGTRVTRKFGENAPLRVLFLFVTGKYGIRVSKLIDPSRVVLVDQDSPIKDQLGDNCVVTVEEEEVSSDDQYDEEPAVREEAKLLDITELDRRRAQAYLYLCANRTICVSRLNIIDTVLFAYRSNLELEHHRLTVVLKDEIAIDLDGVTKEMYQLFFSAFAEKYVTGHLEKVPNNDHRLHTTDLYRTLGRIIAHAYVLCGYWPISMNKATITAALTAAVSPNLALSSFLGMLNDVEKRVLQALLQGTGSEDDQLRCLGVLSRFDCRQRVNNHNAREVLASLASAVTVYRPYHAILQVGQGLTTYQNLWHGVREEHIVLLFENAYPNATKLEDAILPVFSDDEVMRTMEERVIVYLNTWMASLRPDQLIEFFIFWTASNAFLPKQVLKVDFNSIEGFGRRPAATTCSDTLSLSRVYYSQEDFNADMVVVFSEHSKVMDAL